MKKWMESEKFAGTLELAIAIMLGITAVLTAYASWQSSLYGGSQSEKYTNGSAIITEANSLYNESAQSIAQDMSTWDRITDYRIDLAFADQNGDTAAAEQLQWKLDRIMADNVSSDLLSAIEWADAQEAYASPFEKEGFLDTYSATAAARYQEGEDMIADGSKDNSLGDKQGLVTVIFSVVLFLLGIANSFKNNRTKLMLVSVSVLAFLYSVIVMLSVPMMAL